MSLWTAGEAAEATGGTASGWTASGVSIDTRTLEPGDLFVALKAARDGHEFVGQALAKGAAAAMVSRVPDGVDPARCLVVRDVLRGLTDMGLAGRARTDATVVAVTGSVGKTSVKEMMREALGFVRVHAAEASYNNHWGVPITLARAPRDAEAIVSEIGMNAPGEIAPLSKMVRPHVALVTTVAPAHLAAFGRIEGIAAEKASIFEGLEEGGTAVWDADMATAGILAETAARVGARPVTFGETGDWRIVRLEPSEHGTGVHLDGPAGQVDLSVATPGLHMARNAVGALAALHAAGYAVDDLLPGLERWQPYVGRGTVETVEIGGGSIALTDDAFNANPASMRAAFDVLSRAAPRRVAILGDMLELGEEEAAMHAVLADAPAELIHTAGPLMRHLHDALPAAKRGVHADTAGELAAQAGALVAPGDTVLVKGSKGSRVSLVVDALRALGHGGAARGGT